MRKFVPCINNFAARKVFPHREKPQTGEKKPTLRASVFSSGEARKQHAAL
jgi:hypothetical protein